ncbi:MAG: response regulator [Tissierellia bacterium]|nr:response regulator [Tissierellia bacterium]
MLKALIVEDEELIRQKLMFFPDFESLGIKVVETASNGLEGVKLIKKHNPDIVITDIKMPIKDGLSMIEDTLDYDYAAIIVSGFDEFEYAKKALKFGVTDYLLKPVDIDELNEALKQSKNIYEMKRLYQNDISRIEVLKENVHNTKKSDEAILMIDYIKRNFGEKISIKDLETKLNYSESMLNKKFKQYTDMTFNEYLNRYRIKKAIDYMKSSDLIILDIAYLTGFSNPKYFSKVFKKYIGISPGKYQQKLKKEEN